METYITSPQIIRPPYEVPQDQALDWLGGAHAKADANLDPSLIKKLLRRYGCSPDKIAKRGTVLRDATHTNWEQMQIFRFDQDPRGALMSQRMKVYEETVDAVFSEFYSTEAPPPAHLIHVSCTGYVSPSGAQKLVSNRSWPTTVTHAYHMGCYASIPAIRMADGFLHAKGQPVDIVHTELCTLHMNPMAHEPEQLVVQSLFADGFCRYQVVSEKPQQGFRLLDYREEIIPESQDSMTWILSDFGMQMTLHRDVPEIIRARLGGFLGRLTGQTDWSELEFAIHPGGPKIIEGVQSALGLSDEQVKTSREALLDYGNMSSATMPHVWSRMSKGQGSKRIVSLAFGPGLTVCGLLMERV